MSCLSLICLLWYGRRCQSSVRCLGKCCDSCQLPVVPQLPHASNSAWAWAAASKTSSVSIANAPRAAMFANWMETPTKKQHTIYSCVRVCVLNNVTVQLTITITRRNNNKHTTRCIVGWKAITHVLQLPASLFTLAQHTLPPTHTPLSATHTHAHFPPSHTPPLTYTPYFLISANVWTLFSHIFICLASHKMCVNMKHPSTRTHPLAYWNLIRYVAKRNTLNAHTHAHAHTTT